MAPVLLLGLASACSRGDSGKEAGNPEAPLHARVELLAEADALVPGDTLLLGVAFTIDPGWHLYYNGQNDTGYPIRVDPRFPPGYDAGPLAWPAPVRHVSPGGILDHVYTERVLLPFPVRIPGNARPGERVSLGVHVTWMACRETCIPEEAPAVLALPVVEAGVESPPATPDVLSRFQDARSRLPHPREAGPGNLETAWDGGALRIRAPGAVRLAFFPDTASVGLVDLLGTGEAEGDSLRLVPEPGSGSRPLSGVLAITEASGPDTVYISVKEPPPDSPEKETDR